MKSDRYNESDTKKRSRFLDNSERFYGNSSPDLNENPNYMADYSVNFETKKKEKARKGFWTVIQDFNLFN